MANSSETYPLTLPTNEKILLSSEIEFDKETDDEEITLSNDDRAAMEILERTSKRVDQFNFQIAVLFMHINPNMSDNLVQAQYLLFCKRRNLSKKSDARQKYVEKIKRLSDEGYIEKVHLENYKIPGRV